MSERNRTNGTVDMRAGNERGMALVAVMFVMLLLLGMGAAMHTFHRAGVAIETAPLSLALSPMMMNSTSLLFAAAILVAAGPYQRV